MYTGSQAFAIAGLPFYGDPSRGHLGYNGAFMPAQGATSAARSPRPRSSPSCATSATGSSGADPESAEYAKEYETWCSEDSAIYEGLQDGSITFDNITTTAAGADVLPVGTAPRPATPKG